MTYDPQHLIAATEALTDARTRHAAAKEHRDRARAALLEARKRAARELSPRPHIVSAMLEAAKEVDDATTAERAALSEAKAAVKAARVALANAEDRHITALALCSLASSMAHQSARSALDA